MTLAHMVLRMVIVMGLTVVVGCGDGGTRSIADRPEKTADPALPPRPKPVAPAKAAPVVATTAVAAQPREAPRPKRPVELHQWQAVHYFTARADRDSRLIGAIRQLGKEPENKPHTAQLLVELLIPAVQRASWQQRAAEVARQEADDDANRNPSADKKPVRTPSAERPAQILAEIPTARRPPEPIGGYCDAVIGALAANGEPLARQTLRELLLGKHDTYGSDKHNVAYAIRAMADNYDTAYEAMLLALLINGASIRPGERGDVTADFLQTEAMKYVKGHASPAMRRKLAEYAVAPTTAAVERTRLLTLIGTNEPHNLLAQIYLAGSNQVDVVTRRAMQQIVGEHCRQAVDKLLGVPAVAKPGQATNVPAQALARYFWDPEFLSGIEIQVAELTELAKEPEPIRLATGLAVGKLRERMYEKLSSQWERGPVLTNQAMLAAEAIRDPGMLAVIKSLPRDEEVKKKPAGPSRVAEDPALSKQRLARKAWYTLSEQLMFSLNRRFYSAGLRSKANFVTPVADAGSRNAPDNRDSRSAAPLSFPPSAQIAVEHHVAWPGDLQDKMNGVQISPLTVHYYRLEVEESPAKLSTFFERQFKLPAVRNIDSGRWIDSLARKEGSLLRSADVVITFAQRDRTAAGKNAVEKMYVEILWIEVPDPT